jgi:hypothetical protein
MIEKGINQYARPTAKCGNCGSKTCKGCKKGKGC